MRTYSESSTTSCQIFLHCTHFSKDKDCLYQLHERDERLSREEVDSLSLAVFENHVDVALKDMVW